MLFSLINQTIGILLFNRLRTEISTMKGIKEKSIKEL